MRDVSQPERTQPDMFPSLAAQVLIAMPTIGDPRFERSVIYLCVHDSQGATGIVLNKPDRKRSLGDILRELELDPGGALESTDRRPTPVLLGGPVEKSRGFVLHTPVEAKREGTVAVSDDVHLSTTLDVLRDIARGRGPERFLLALGLASWSAGQLDEEIRSNVWLHSPMSSAQLFDTPPELHYASCLAGLGVDLNHLSPFAGRG
jgi:putative transcriptional regulator